MVNIPEKQSTQILITFFTSYLLLINLYLVFNLSQGQGIHLQDESIIITINEENAQVKARYGLINYEDKTTYNIILPFARKPWNITLRTAEYLMDFSWGTYYSRKVDILFSAIVFNVTIEKNQRKDIYIDYQRNYSIVGVNKSITTGKFRYIVGSTESWGKALKFSHFEIWINEPIGKKMAEVRHYRNWMPQDFYEQFTFTLKK